MKEDKMKTYEYEERAFIDESEFLPIKAKLEKIARKVTLDNKISYFYIFPDKNISIAASAEKTVVKYKAGKIGIGNGFEEHEFAIQPDHLSAALKFFSSVFQRESFPSEQFRINYELPDSIEVALKYTNAWGFHLEVEKVYFAEEDEDISAKKDQARDDVDAVSKKLGIEHISDAEMKVFLADCVAGKLRGYYSPDEFRKKYGKLFE